MSEIRYARKHHLSLKQAKHAAQQAANDLAEEYDLESEWEGDTLHFHRSGLEGRMRVTDSAVELVVKLGFLLRPFKSSFEEHIEQHLAERLGGKPAKSTPRAAKASRRKA